MHFLNWLLEQQDEPGDSGLLANVIWADINNGCGLRFTSPVEWSQHFSIKHKKTAEILNDLLNEAFILYAAKRTEALDE